MSAQLRFSVVLLCALNLPSSGSLGAEEGEKQWPKRILTLKRTDIYAGQPTVEELRKQKNRVSVLLKCLSQAKSEDQRAIVLKVFKEIGTVTLAPDPARRPQRYLASREVIQALVGLLNSEKSDVRALAVRYLTYYCLDENIRPWSRAIVRSVQKRKWASAALLLGKLGSAEARQLLRGDKSFQRGFPRCTNMALAKLGDAALEKRFVKEFLAEKDPKRKIDFAKDLGYIATPGAVAALAGELRSPMVLRMGRTGRFSLRVFIIEGLRRALPHNKLFWKPKPRPTSDKYYQAIEKWAEDVMMIRWKRKRPPFLYEIPNMTPLRR